MWTQIRLVKEQSDQGPHCLPVCKNRFEKSARIYSRRHKQTTFSDAVFLGALRVKLLLLETKTSGPVVQSVVSFTSTLVVKIVTVLVSTISNLQVFF